jgi:hypothetical protein
VPPEPLSLSVHDVAVPDLADPELAQRRRTVQGRIKMLLVLLVCAAPVIASYLAFYVLRPQARSNYAALIQPSRSLPALALRNLDGQPVVAASLRGQWLLLALGPARCTDACERRLYVQRQLREMLGREKDRLDKLWLVTDAGEVPALLRASLQVGGPADVTILRADRAALAQWLEPQSGQALEDHLYLVDPMGEWMMRVPVEPDPTRLKRDLERLLRASASWDRPGR